MAVWLFRASISQDLECIWASWRRVMDCSCLAWSPKLSCHWSNEAYWYYLKCSTYFFEYDVPLSGSWNSELGVPSCQRELREPHRLASLALASLEYSPSFDIDLARAYYFRARASQSSAGNPCHLYPSKHLAQGHPCPATLTPLHHQISSLGWWRFCYGTCCETIFAGSYLRNCTRQGFCD